MSIKGILLTRIRTECLISQLYKFLFSNLMYTATTGTWYFNVNQYILLLHILYLDPLLTLSAICWHCCGLKHEAFVFEGMAHNVIIDIDFKVIFCKTYSFHPMEGVSFCHNNTSFSAQHCLNISWYRTRVPIWCQQTARKEIRGACLRVYCNIIQSQCDVKG